MYFASSVELFPLATFDAMETLFNIMKVKNDGVYDRDNDSTTWTTTIAIYDRTDCSNPNMCIPIYGFTTVMIEMVMGPSEKTIRGTIICTDNDQDGFNRQPLFE